MTPRMMRILSRFIDGDGELNIPEDFYLSDYIEDEHYSKSYRLKRNRPHLAAKVFRLVTGSLPLTNGSPQ
jgi:hypothetical protein